MSTYDHAFRGEIFGRKFIPDDWARWRNALEHFEAKRVRVTVGREDRGRSTPQLKYYWGVIVRGIMTWCGEDDEDVIHYELLTKVLAPMLPERFLKPLPNGERLTLKPSTTQLTLEEMQDFIGRCRAYAYEHFGGITFPDEDQVSLR